MASTMECNIREEEEESWSDLSDLSEFEDEEFDDPISIRNSTLPKDIFTTSPPASSSSSSHSRNTANHSRSTAPAPSLPQQRDLSSHSMSLSSRSTSTSSQESLSSCSRSSSSAVFSSMSPSARSLPHPISSVSSLPSSSSRGHHQQQQQRRPHSMKRPSGSSVPHRPSSAASASGGSSAGTQSHRNSLDLPHHAARAPLLAFERPPSSSPQARPLSGGSASLSSLSLSAGGGAHAARPSTPTTRHATSSSPMPAYTSSSSSSSSSNSHKRAISHAQFSASRSTQASSSSSSGSPSRRSDHRRTRGAPDSPYANARSHSSATSSSSSGANALRLNVKQKSKSGRPGNLTPSNTLREEILSTFARPSALSSSAAGQPTPENSPTNAKYHYHSRSSSNSCSLTPAPAQLERTDSHPLQRELMKDKAAAVKSKLVDADVDADVRVRSVSPTPKQGDCTSRRASRSDRNKTSLLPNGISAADDPEHEQQPTGSRMRSDSELTQPDSLVASRQSTLSRTGNGSRTDTGSRGTEKLTESRVRAHNGAGGHDKAALGGLHRQTSTDTQASTSTVREEDFVEATSDPTLGVERASSFPAATSREGANTANTRSSAASLSRSSTRSKSKSLSRRATGTSSTTPPQAMEWTIDEVVRWLFSLGKSFEAYEDEFRHNGISGRCLLEDVNEATIGDLVHVKLHQARIMREIQILKGTYRPSSFVEGADASSPSSSSSSSSSSHPSSSSSHPSSSSSSSRKKQHRRTRSSSSGKLLKSPTYSKSRPTSAAGTSTNSATSPSTSATSTSSGGSATGTTKSRSRERSISPSFNSSSKRKHRSRRGSRTTSSASSSSTVASRQRSRRNSRNAAHPSRVAIPSNMGSAPSPSPSPTQAPSKPRGKFAHLRSRSSHQFNVRTPSQRRQHTNSHSFASPPPSLQIRQLSQRDVTNEGVGAELADRASASSSASHRSVKQRMRRRSSTALRSPSVILRGKSPSRSRSGINTDALIADFDASSPIVGAVSVDLKGKDDTPASSSSLKSKFKMRSPRLASASSRFAAVSGLSRISSAFRKSKSPRLDGGADTPEPSPATRPMMLRSRGNSIVSATSVDSTYLAQTSHDATSAAMEDDKFDLDSLSYGQLSRSYSNMSVTSTESGNSARGRAGSPSPTPGQGGGTSSAASRGGRPVPRLHAASQNFTGHGGRGRKPRLQRERTMHVSPTGSPSPHAVRHRRMQTQPALVRMSSVPVNARGSTATGQAAIDFLQQYHMPSSAATPGSSPRNIASLKRLMSGPVMPNSETARPKQTTMPRTSRARGPPPGAASAGSKGSTHRSSRRRDRSSSPSPISGDSSKTPTASSKSGNTLLSPRSAMAYQFNTSSNFGRSRGSSLPDTDDDADADAGVVESPGSGSSATAAAASPASPITGHKKPSSPLQSSSSRASFFHRGTRRPKSRFPAPPERKSRSKSSTRGEKDSRAASKTRRSDKVSETPSKSSQGVAAPDQRADAQPRRMKSRRKASMGSLPRAPRSSSASSKRVSRRQISKTVRGLKSLERNLKELRDADEDLVDAATYYLTGSVDDSSSSSSSSPRVDGKKPSFRKHLMSSIRQKARNGPALMRAFTAGGTSVATAAVLPGGTGNTDTIVPSFDVLDEICEDSVSQSSSKGLSASRPASHSRSRSHSQSSVHSATPSTLSRSHTNPRSPRASGSPAGSPDSGASVRSPAKKQELPLGASRRFSKAFYPLSPNVSRPRAFSGGDSGVEERTAGCVVSHNRTISVSPNFVVQREPSIPAATADERHDKQPHTMPRRRSKPGQKSAASSSSSVSSSSATPTPRHTSPPFQPTPTPIYQRRQFQPMPMLTKSMSASSGIGGAPHINSEQRQLSFTLRAENPKFALKVVSTEAPRNGSQSSSSSGVGQSAVVTPRSRTVTLVSTSPRSSPSCSPSPPRSPRSADVFNRARTLRRQQRALKHHNAAMKSQSPKRGSGVAGSGEASSHHSSTSSREGDGSSAEEAPRSRKSRSRSLSFTALSRPRSLSQNALLSRRHLHKNSSPEDTVHVMPPRSHDTTMPARDHKRNFSQAISPGSRRGRTRPAPPPRPNPSSTKSPSEVNVAPLAPFAHRSSSEVSHRTSRGSSGPGHLAVPRPPQGPPPPGSLAPRPPSHPPPPGGNATASAPGAPPGRKNNTLSRSKGAGVPRPPRPPGPPPKSDENSGDLNGTVKREKSVKLLEDIDWRNVDKPVKSKKDKLITRSQTTPFKPNSPSQSAKNSSARTLPKSSKVTNAGTQRALTVFVSENNDGGDTRAENQGSPLSSQTQPMSTRFAKKGYRMVTTAQVARDPRHSTIDASSYILQLAAYEPSGENSESEMSRMSISKSHYSVDGIDDMSDDDVVGDEETINTPKLRSVSPRAVSPRNKKSSRMFAKRSSISISVPSRASTARSSRSSGAASTSSTASPSRSPSRSRKSSRGRRRSSKKSTGARGSAPESLRHRRASSLSAPKQRRQTLSRTSAGRGSAKRRSVVLNKTHGRKASLEPPSTAWSSPSSPVSSSASAAPGDAGSVHSSPRRTAKFLAHTISKIDASNVLSLKRSHPSSDAVQGFLEIPTARQYFKEYLKSRFAAENLLFWIECSDFEQLDFDQRVQRFKRILVTYLSHDASNQVSLPSQIQKDLLAVDPENPAADVFDVALKSVLRLLRMPFSEFLDSDEYKKYTQSASGRILLNAAASDYASSDQASDEGSIDSSRHKRYATVGHATLSHSRSNPSTLLHAFDEDGESKSEHDDPGSRSRSHDTAPGRTSSSDTLSAGAAPAVGKKKNREDWFDFLDAGIVPDKEHDEFLEIANKGQEVLKHGRRGAPNKRKLRVDMKKRALVYQRRTISFAQIAAIKDGKQSALYQTRAALQEIDEALCLSIYLDTSSQDKTIDLQFPSASTRDLWSRHLQRCIIDHEA